VAGGSAAYRRAFAAIDADPAHLLVAEDDAGAPVATLQLSLKLDLRSSP
jgi:hypothetical protein